MSKQRKKMVLSESSRRAPSSRVMPVTRREISSDSEADDSDLRSSREEEETNPTTHTSASSDDDDHPIRFIHSNPRETVSGMEISSDSEADDSDFQASREEEKGNNPTTHTAASSDDDSDHCIRFIRSNPRETVSGMEISSDSEADGSDFRASRKEEETNPTTHTAASSSDDDSDHSIQFIGSNPRGRINETDDEDDVVALTEAEFLERIEQCSSKKIQTDKCRAKTPPASYSSVSQEEDIPSDEDSTEEESMAHELQDTGGISTRTCSRGKKHHAGIAKSELSDTEYTYSYYSYCSVSESDDSDDPDCGSSSCIRSQGMGGKKGKEHIPRSECVVERVHDEDTRERKKKKPMVEVEHVVEQVHEEDTRERKEKSTVEVDPVVKLVHQGLMGGKKGKKHTARSEWVGERVYDEDTNTRERNVEVDPVVESVHQGPMGGKGGKYAVPRQMGRVHKKHAARPYSIAKQVQEPMREEREKLVRKRAVVRIKELEPRVSHNKSGKNVNKGTTVEIGEKRVDERQKSVGRRRVVAEQVQRAHRNGDFGVDSSHEMRDSLSPFHEEKEQVHKTDPGNSKGEEVMDETVENPAKRSDCDSPGEERDFRRLLLDSLLNDSPMLVEEKSSKSDIKLPLKFRFDDDDEIPKPKEKTEFQIKMKNHYAVMKNYLAQSIHQQEVKEDVAESSCNGTSEDHRCCKEHDYVEDDATGMVCRICQHIGLEAKDVQLRWAEKPFRRVRKRKYPCDGERPREECIRFAPGESSRTVFLNPGVGTVWDIKPGVRDSMYKHQQEGFEFLWKNMAGSIDLAEITSSCNEFGGCIISHAPGTGKTRLTMMFVETYLMLFPDSRPVIIAPSSLLLTWEGEFRKWNVEFPFHNLNNPEVSVEESKLAQRLSNKKVPNSEDIRLAKIHSWTKEQSVLGMSYNLFAKLVGEKRPTKKSVQEKEPDPELKMILLEKPGLVVLDEGHIPRNQTSSIWNALQKLRTEKRVILSGTPFQNNFRELFNVMQVARPSFAISLEKDPRFAEMISSNKKKLETMEQKDMDKAILDLKTAMAPYVNTYNDSSFLQSKLPGLRDFLLILKPTGLQKRIIEEMEKPKSTFESEAKVALVSVHPSLFNPSEKEKLRFDEAEVKKSKPKPDEGVKTRFLMELVRISMARNEKVLVFSQYIEPLMLLRQQLCKGFNWGDNEVLMIKGKMDQKQRQKLMASFNNPNDEAKVLLASTRCCSEGVSLVGASRVVLLDVVWNPAVERQAICRAYRIGQTKIVYTYHLMASGTSEMDKYRQQSEKDRLSEMVFSASSAGTSILNDTDERIEDIVLENMVANVDFKQIFDKITYHFISQSRGTNNLES